MRQCRQPTKHSDFNPRSPRGERLGDDVDNCPKNTISIHAPREGSDLIILPPLFVVGISIHAPREGSDADLGKLAGVVAVFQSTLPARGATRARPLLRISPRISIHAPREGSDSNIAQIFTIRTAILQHGYQTRLVFGTKSIVLNRKKSFKLPVFLREPTGLFMFTSGSRHGRSKNQRVGHIYGGACTDVLNLSLI